MRRVSFRGVGAFVPRRVISNEKIARAIPGWPPERIEEKIGIRERRFLWDVNAETGQAIPPPDDAELYPANNVEMCEVALVRALQSAQLHPRELDAIFVVTCSPDELNFNHDAMALHDKLGCRPDAYAFVIDDGCGGTPYVIDMAKKMIEGGAFRTIAVVGSSFTSPYVNRDVFTAQLPATQTTRPMSGYLSMYVFGDGASAVVLRGEEADGEPTGIVSSMAGTAHAELVVHRAGGALKLPYQGRASLADQAFIVDGMQVARSYPVYMRRCIDAVTGGDASVLKEVKRFYFHQPNKRLLDRFIESAELPKDRVPCHVEKYGNTSAAGMLTLLAEDVEAGHVRLGSGDLVLMAAVGANVHFGAQLIRL